MGLTVCVAFFTAVLIISGSSAHVQGESNQDRASGLVIALDLSGSVRPYFDQVQATAEELLQTVPEGSRLAMIGFDENAEEIARTQYLTKNQRRMFRERLASLRPEGQWTDFEAATAQIVNSVDALDGTSVLVIFTDAISDPAPGSEFHELDHLLCKASIGDREAQSFIVVPNTGKAPLVTGCDSVHIAILGDIAVEEILEPISVEQISIPSVKLSDIPLFKILVFAGFLGVVVLVVAFLRPIIQRRRREEDMDDPQTSSGPIFDMIARHGEASINLGPVDELDQITIGTIAGCDVQLSPPEDHDFELAVRQKSGRFKIVNRSDVPVEINGADIAPGKSNWLTFPAHLIMSEHLKVFLLQVPRQEVV